MYCHVVVVPTKYPWSQDRDIYVVQNGLSMTIVTYFTGTVRTRKKFIQLEERE